MGICNVPLTVSVIRSQIYSIDWYLFHYYVQADIQNALNSFGLLAALLDLWAYLFCGALPVWFNLKS